jgi:beta-lactamase superfamily II metal-dependent hydrolase
LELITKILKAGNGDAILISFKDDHQMKFQNILVDGGGKLAYQENLKVELIDLIKLGECIDLLIVTHIDQDHIGGIIKLFEDLKSNNLYYENKKGNKNYLKIKKIWFNSNSLLYNKNFWLSEGSKKISKKQGAKLQLDLENKEGFVNEFVARPDLYDNDKGIIYVGKSKITVLAPTQSYLIAYNQRINGEWENAINQIVNRDINGTKISLQQRVDNKKSMQKLIKLAENQKDNELENNDTSPENLSSIALLFEYNNKSLLLLGDSPHEIVSKSLRDLGFTEKKPTKVDYVKLSHHAGAKNTSFELLSLIDCKNYIISSDGQNNDLPNKLTLAKIISAKVDGVNFLFNYPASNYNFSFYDTVKEENEQNIYKFTTIFNNYKTGFIIDHGN